jgi:hypothetical protein
MDLSRKPFTEEQIQKFRSDMKEGYEFERTKLK